MILIFSKSFTLSLYSCSRIFQLYIGKFIIQKLSLLISCSSIETPTFNVKIEDVDLGNNFPEEENRVFNEVQNMAYNLCSTPFISLYILAPLNVKKSFSFQRMHMIMKFRSNWSCVISFLVNCAVKQTPIINCFGTLCL